MKKNSKIYVAGHTGLVGTNLTRKLKESGYENTIYENRQNLDLVNQESVSKFFLREKPEYVFLLAAKLGGINEKINFPAEYLYENLMIQNNVIWAAHQNGVKKLLFIGSSAVYPSNSNQPLKKDYLLKGPLSKTEEPYGLAKISGIKLCEYIYTEFNKKFISCMPTNIYGIGEPVEGENMQVIPSLIDRMYKAKISNQKQVDIWGSGKQQRDFIYVEDLVSALIFLMNDYEEKDPINIGNVEVVSIKELAYTIKGVVQYEGVLKFDITKPEGVLLRYLDTSRLQNLGFKCNINIKEGVRKTYDYYLNKIKENHV